MAKRTSDDDASNTTQRWRLAYAVTRNGGQTHLTDARRNDGQTLCGRIVAGRPAANSDDAGRATCISCSKAYRQRLQDDAHEQRIAQRDAAVQQRPGAAGVADRLQSATHALLAARKNSASDSDLAPLVQRVRDALADARKLPATTTTLRQRIAAATRALHVVQSMRGALSATVSWQPAKLDDVRRRSKRDNLARNIARQARIAHQQLTSDDDDNDAQDIVDTLRTLRNAVQVALDMLHDDTLRS